MEYNEFLDKLVEGLEKKMGERYVISIRVNLKENGKRVKGISIIDRDNKNGTAPVIYADGYFREYVEDGDMDTCVESMIESYVQCKDVSFGDIERLADWEKCKGWIYPILIHRDKNKELLKRVAYRKYLDLAVCYIIRIPQEAEEGNAMARVDKDKLKMWNINEEELHQTAIGNLFNDGYQILGMAEVVKDLLDLKSLEEDGNEDLFESEKDNDMGSHGSGKDTEKYNCGCDNLIEDDFDMYVLTNKRRYYGAVCMLNTDVLESFGRRIQNNFYIIPSSLHEVILVPYADDTQAEQLREIINEVNQEMVEPEEVLSDHAYFYDRELKKVRCV